MVGTTEEICDPERCSIEEAVIVARQRARENLSYDLQIAQFVNSQWLSNTVNLRIAERGLEILGAIASPARLLSVLRTAMAQTDPEVRSKAAIALGKYLENPTLIERLAMDGDPRVRANTIEALWGRAIPEAEAIFRRALIDRHHRVAANAAYGLYLIDSGKYLTAVEAFVEHSRQGHRTAAAWLIRKIGDACLLGLLKTLVRDQNPDVRRAAFLAIGALRASSASVPQIRCGSTAAVP